MKHKLATALFAMGSLSIMFTSASGITAFAEEQSAYEGYSAEEFSALQQTTVVKSEESPTGYYVTFRYPNSEGTDRVRLYGEYNFSDEAHTNVFQTAHYTPEEWQDGYFPAFVGRDSENQVIEMELDEENQVWSVTLPLPNGTWNYAFYIGGVGEELNDTEEATMVWDPNNEPIIADLTLPDEEYMPMEKLSRIYVPIDEEKQANTAYNPYEIPREDGQTGTVIFETLQNRDGDDLTTGIYLPYGFDADREEPYKVLVYQVGGGNAENDPFMMGVADIITDNLIAEGETEPFIIVTENGNDFGWDRDLIMSNITEYILPYVEENYNVSTDAADHAFLGISMGGATSVYAMLHNADDFDYFAVFSAPVTEDISEEIGSDDVTGLGLEEKNIFFARGTSDFVAGLGNEREGSYLSILNTFTDSQIPYTNMVYNGGHQFTVWRPAYTDFVQNVLWK
jgi:enterochelin esterase-like enzyme